MLVCTLLWYCHTNFSINKNFLLILILQNGQQEILIYTVQNQHIHLIV